MKIALIQPSIGKTRNKPYVKSWNMYPLNLSVIAGLTPEDIDITFYDDRHESISFYEGFDLVAMPVETYTAKRAYVLADSFRENGTRVVLGGMHTTMLPNEAENHADSVVIGDSELTWPNLIHDFKGNNLQKKYSSNMNGKVLPHIKPNREIFNGYSYLPVELVESGRGCYHSCDFCSVSSTYKKSYRSKSIEDIVSDIETLSKNFVYFVDDNFISDKSRTKELCKALTPLKIRWTSQGSIDMADDEELLTSMQKSGCFNMLIGFESLNPEALKLMGKNWTSSKRTYSESIKKIRDHGITLYATFVFGYDCDKKDDFKRTLDFAIEQKFAITAFNHLVPFPGTPLYSRLEKEKRLIYPDWWLRENGKFGEVVFKPKNMTPEELAEGCFNCREEFYKFGPILNRLTDFKANSRNLMNLAYISYVNLFSRKEAKKRQGWPIGVEIENEQY
jgi:radical SAM superfamily enzyme YgiQ (UPF0313 family)